MSYTRIDPIEYPRVNGESWWVVHPNTKGSEFKIPSGAVTACIGDFLEFKAGTVYYVIEMGAEKGWVGVKAGNEIYIMPEYIFARHFDAEAFVVGPAPTIAELEGAVPYNYKPTVPVKPSEKPQQLELFNDDPSQWYSSCGADNGK